MIIIIGIVIVIIVVIVTSRPLRPGARPAVAGREDEVYYVFLSQVVFFTYSGVMSLF